MDVRRVEDDAEKSTMRFLEYRSHRQEMIKNSADGKLTMKDRDQLSSVAMKHGLLDKSLKRCLQSEDVVRYWEALMSVAPEGQRFFNTIHFSSKWSDKTIHQPGGGVSQKFLVHSLLANPLVAVRRNRLRSGTFLQMVVYPLHVRNRMEQVQKNGKKKFVTKCDAQWDKAVGKPSKFDLELFRRSGWKPSVVYGQRFDDRGLG